MERITRFNGLWEWAWLRFHPPRNQAMETRKISGAETDGPDAQLFPPERLISYQIAPGEVNSFRRDG